MTPAAQLAAALSHRIDTDPRKDYEIALAAWPPPDGMTRTEAAMKTAEGTAKQRLRRLRMRLDAGQMPNDADLSALLPALGLNRGTAKRHFASRDKVITQLADMVRCNRRHDA